MYGGEDLKPDSGRLELRLHDGTPEAQPEPRPEPQPEAQPEPQPEPEPKPGPPTPTLTLTLTLGTIDIKEGFYMENLEQAC